MNKLPIAFDKYMKHGFKLTDTEKSFLQKIKIHFQMHLPDFVSLYNAYYCCFIVIFIFQIYILYLFHNYYHSHIYNHHKSYNQAQNRN